jgi:type I restriction-modification system DNA methylase subunit
VSSPDGEFAKPRVHPLPDLQQDPLMSEKTHGKQLLHLVFGGELSNLAETEFKDLNKLDIVGLYPNYASAYTAWKAKAQRTVDNAHMRYFIVHLHRLLDPDSTVRPGG